LSLITAGFIFLEYIYRVRGEGRNTAADRVRR